jgi:hypothetical protein
MPASSSPYDDVYLIAYYEQLEKVAFTLQPLPVRRALRYKITLTIRLGAYRVCPV